MLIPDLGPGTERRMTAATELQRILGLVRRRTTSVMAYAAMGSAIAVVREVAKTMAVVTGTWSPGSAIDHIIMVPCITLGAIPQAAVIRNIGMAVPTGVAIS